MSLLNLRLGSLDTTDSELSRSHLTERDLDSRSLEWLGRPSQAI